MLVNITDSCSTFTRKYGTNERFVVYKHAALTKNPDYVMNKLINIMNLEFEDTLLVPTIAERGMVG